VVITFANPEVALRILRAVRELREDVPILVRTQDDTKLEELQAAGATEVVPETFEASLMLLSHLLLLLKLHGFLNFVAPRLKVGLSQDAA